MPLQCRLAFQARHLGPNGASDTTRCSPVGTKAGQRHWKAEREMQVKKRKAAQSFLALATMTLLGCVIGFFLMSDKESTIVRANSDVTTETAAAAAGAPVTPTDSKLRIEPK